MKLNNWIFFIVSIGYSVTQVNAMIHPEFDGQGVMQLKISATKYKQQAAAFEVFKNGEVVAYARCLSAHQAAGDDDAAKAAAYTPLFEGYKAKAKDAVATLIQKICPGDDDTVPFLHDEIVVGADQPANPTRGGFIAWLNGRINTITTADAVNGIRDLHLLGVHLPKDGDGPEFILFTTGLKKFIANFANLSIQELGRKNGKTNLLNEEVAKKLGASFPYEQSDNLGRDLYEAIKGI